MTEQTARYPRGKLLTIGAALLVFAAVKVAALLWWQQQEQPETAARAQCAADGVAASGCLFLDGARFRLRLGAGHGAPLVLLAENVPPDVRELSASFRMKDMDMGDRKSVV